MTPKPVTGTKNVNKFGAVLVFAIAAPLSYVAFDLYRLFAGHDDLTGENIGIVLVLAAVCLGMIMAAVWLWRKPVARRLEITFRDGGFQIFQRSIYGREQSHDVDWSDVRQIRLVDAPRGASSIRFRTTFGDFSVIPALAEQSNDDIMARLQASARQSGRSFENEKKLMMLIQTHVTWDIRDTV